MNGASMELLFKNILYPRMFVIISIYINKDAMVNECETRDLHVSCEEPQIACCEKGQNLRKCIATKKTQGIAYFRDNEL